MKFGTNLSVVESCDDFEVIDSQIADVNIMFSLLTKLYNDLPKIIVQEYITNARDAHREIGIEDRPIQITLPTYFTNELVIRDFGPGISPERIRTVFVHLGASTKRGNNSQTGGFGIGAKSAFCYTDSFNVDTFIDGTKYQYTFIKAGDTGKPQMIFIGEEPTIEENGTQITISVKSSDINKVCANVYKLTQFWDVRPEIVNGDTFSGEKYKDYEVIAEGTNYKFFNGGSETYVVLDGIPYGFSYSAVYDGWADREKYKAIFDSNAFNFFFKTGEVSISPNREGLSYDNETVVTIRKVVDEAIVEITENTQKHIDSIDNIHDAKDAIARFSNLSMFTKGLTWRGHKLNEFNLDSKFYKVYHYRMYRNKLRQENAYVLDINRSNNYVLNDEDEIPMSRIKTIHNTSRYNGYYVIDSVEYEENPTQTLEEFEQEREEYEKNICLKSLGLTMLSDYEKCVSPKKVKIKGNVYRFIRNAKSSRDSWDIEDVEYDDLEGYYVEFLRGEANGYDLSILNNLKRKYGITIYGVPTRYLGKISDNENLSTLQSFIDDKYAEFEEFIEENKEIIHSKQHLSNYNEDTYFLENIGNEVVEVIKQDNEFEDFFKVYSDLKKYSSMQYDMVKMNEIDAFNRMIGRNYHRIRIESLETYPLKDKLFKKYPMLSLVANRYIDDDVRKHAKYYVKMIQTNSHLNHMSDLGVLDVTETC